MKKRFIPALCCALLALSVLPVRAEGESSSAPQIPTVGDGGSVLVDILALALAAVILCAVVFLFYRVLRPKSGDDAQRSKRLKRR